MAQSFYRPRADRMIEDFDSEPFFHQASGRYYRMRREGERLFFERYELDTRGQPIHRFEVEVDWIVGSGHTTRTYLFQNPSGELNILPISWYSQSGKWGMMPGFDRAEHLGVKRQVRRECMFCHNAYPEVPVGDDVYGMPHEFPDELPEGIGCQRCHGPGAEHMRAALRSGKAAARAAIVNPGRLPPEREMDICYGCHFQPSVALAGVRRFGRATYSFRPGEPLTDYLALIDVEEQDQSREQRFEINHHPYRLEQSTCFLESELGELTCTTCHDPHRKVPKKKRPKHYREACFSCHQLDSCSLDAMADAADLKAKGLGNVAEDDCVSCHMPRRRTQDVIEVVMTDHRIQRIHGGTELLTPLEETFPVLTDAKLVRPLPGVDPQLAEIYRASAVLRAGSNLEAVDFLTHALPARQFSTKEPLLDLMGGLVTAGRFKEAEAVANKALEVWPDLVQALGFRTVARFGLGLYEEALADVEILLAKTGEHPEPLFNQGAILYELSRYEEAVDSLTRALELNPSLARAWAFLARTFIQLRRPDEAIEAFERSLSIDPMESRVVIELGRLLDEEGHRAEALRILEHGTRKTYEAEKVQRVLDLMTRQEEKHQETKGSR